MPLSQLLNRPVTIIRRSESGDADDYGNDIPTEATVDTVGELQQRQRDEPDGQGDLSVTAWLLILPAGTAIDTNDLVEIDGDRYEVIGQPWTARNPRTGIDSHIEATLKVAG